MPRITITNTDVDVLTFTPEPGYAPERVVEMLNAWEAAVMGNQIIKSHEPPAEGYALIATVQHVKPKRTRTVVLTEGGE